MRTCPRCSASFGDTTAYCPSDGSLLVTSSSIVVPGSDGPADAAGPAPVSGGRTTFPAPAARLEDAPIVLGPGTRVGEYVIEAKIGEGGMGVVFSGTHPLIGKRVAIKVLAARSAADKTSVQRFLQEARAVNQIRHRNIVDIFLFDSLPDGRNYFVMELLEGESLKDRLTRGRFELLAALTLLVPIADALRAAHAQQIVHRDLKPDNVFLARDPDGEITVKVLDFGVAKLVADDAGSVTQTGALLGTPLYMAPEQCISGAVDARADIYSFGALMFEMLTGERACQGGTIFSIIESKRRAPRAPSTLVTLPREIDELVVRCLAPSPADRPASFAEVRAVLLRHAPPGSLSRSTGPHSIVTERSAALVGPRRRRPWLPAAAIGVVLAAGALWLVYGRTHGEHVATPAPRPPTPPATRAAPIAPAPSPAPAPAPSGSAGASAPTSPGPRARKGTSRKSHADGPTRQEPAKTASEPIGDF